MKTYFWSIIVFSSLLSNRGFGEIGLISLDGERNWAVYHRKEKQIEFVECKPRAVDLVQNCEELGDPVKTAYDDFFLALSARLGIRNLIEYRGKVEYYSAEIERVRLEIKDPDTKKALIDQLQETLATFNKKKEEFSQLLEQERKDLKPNEALYNKFLKYLPPSAIDPKKSPVWNIDGAERLSGYDVRAGITDRHLVNLVRTIFGEDGFIRSKEIPKTLLLSSNEVRENGTFINVVPSAFDPGKYATVILSCPAPGRCFSQLTYFNADGTKRWEDKPEDFKGYNAWARNPVLKEIGKGKFVWAGGFTGASDEIGAVRILDDNGGNPTVQYFSYPDLTAFVSLDKMSDGTLVLGTPKEALLMDSKGNILKKIPFKVEYKIAQTFVTTLDDVISYGASDRDGCLEMVSFSKTLEKTNWKKSLCEEGIFIMPRTGTAISKGAIVIGGLIYFGERGSGGLRQIRPFIFGFNEKGLPLFDYGYEQNDFSESFSSVVYNAKSSTILTYGSTVLLFDEKGRPLEQLERARFVGDEKIEASIETAAAIPNNEGFMIGQNELHWRKDNFTRSSKAIGAVSSSRHSP